MAIEIKDLEKIIKLLKESKKEIGRVYGPRIKEKIGLYNRLSQTLKDIRRKR